MIRPIADRLSASLGQAVIVENRPGAAGIVAMEVLTRAAPDGYTLAVATMSQAVFNGYLFSKLPYDPQRDLEPVASLVTGVLVLAANPAFPANSLDELVKLARRSGEKFFVAMPQTEPRLWPLRLPRRAPGHRSADGYRAAGPRWKAQSACGDRANPGGGIA